MTTKKEPFSLKINFEINSHNIKKFFKKFPVYIILLGSGGTIVHGTILPDFYISILKKFQIILASLFR